MTQIWFPGRQIVIQDWKTGKTTRGAALFNPPAGRVDETDFKRERFELKRHFVEESTYNMEIGECAVQDRLECAHSERG